MTAEVDNSTSCHANSHVHQDQQLYLYSYTLQWQCLASAVMTVISISSHDGSCYHQQEQSRQQLQAKSASGVICTSNSSHAVMQSSRIFVLRTFTVQCPHCICMQHALATRPKAQSCCRPDSVIYYLCRMNQYFHHAVLPMHPRRCQAV